jgi:hypothetical protein
MRRLLPFAPLHGLALTLTIVAGACTTPQEDPPESHQLDGVARASLIPEAPTSTPTPPPNEPEPLPANPGGGGGDDGGVADVAGSCGSPTPPAITRMGVGVLSSQPGWIVLDSTPMVGPDRTYCQLIGYTDGRLFCPVRPDGHPERSACEALQVGRATDTGRPGPTWTANGKPCTGRSRVASCENHAHNQYLAAVFGEGIFRACTAANICGELRLP